MNSQLYFFQVFGCLLKCGSTRRSHLRCSIKKVCFEKICKIHRKTLVPEYLFCYSGRHKACYFVKKETLAQVFSSQFCEILKHSLFFTFGRLLLSTMHIFQTIKVNTSIKVSFHSNANENVKIWLKYKRTYVKALDSA